MMADGNAFSAFTRRRTVPLIMQTEAAECCLACLAMVAHYHGYEATLPSLRRRFNPSLRGATLSRAIEIAQAIGLNTRALRTEIDYLVDAQLPCILHWNLNHFVVLTGINKRGVEIFDPARGKYHLTLSEVSKHFTGVLLELTPSSDFKKSKEAQKISIKSIIGKIFGVKKAAAQILVLALAIEFIALVLPFQVQLVMDQILVSGDENLLFLVTLAFLLIIGLQTSLYVARGWVLSWLGGSLNAQWVSNLFAHLLKLPMDYFEKRHIGDITSRFGSLQSIQNTLTGSFVQGILDGLMGSFALTILCIYSVPLTGIIVVSSAMYGIFRLGMYQSQKRINEEQLVFVARQQSELMESVRGIQAIKLANKQSVRSARLSHVTLEASKRGVYSQRIGLTFGALNIGIFGAQRALLIAVGAYLVLKGTFSAGMLIAYLLYADQFTGKVGGLIDKTVEFHMLHLHAERIADIALNAPDENVHTLYSGPSPKPYIETTGLGFRYSEADPWIVRNLNLRFNEGESVAIVGSSGCGKTTLVKLLLGLLKPTEGSIKIGGIDIRQFGLDKYRELIGAVMQGDELFAGPIADNISFFDDRANMQQVIDAASAAAIHNEIISMPMGYESLVGDMGSVLSGGQKQRVILARALFRRPEILILDEATSHLDINNERLVNDHIRSMKITRISIAHRNETVAMSDRVIDLERLG